MPRLELRANDDRDGDRTLYRQILDYVVRDMKPELFSELMETIGGVAYGLCDASQT